MRKHKKTIAVLTLGLLTYLAWLSRDGQNPRQTESPAAPSQVLSENPLPAPLATPLPRRAEARKAVKPRKVTTIASSLPIEPMKAEPVVAQPENKPTGKASLVPLPGIWEGTLVKLDRPEKKKECGDVDRPCLPRGRDGVLLVGVSFPLNNWKPQMPQLLAVGSYEDRTPLLVYK